MVAYDTLNWAAWHLKWPLMVIVGGMSCLLMWHSMRTLHALRGLSASAHRDLMLHNYGAWRIFARSVLYIIAIGCIAIGLLRPQVHIVRSAEDADINQGQLLRDVVIAIDVSRSMLCRDATPHRLGVAQNVAHRLVTELGTDRVGLVLFAGDAFVQCPLTTDKGAAHMFIDALDAGMISSGSTNLAAPLLCAARLLGEQRERSNRLIVIITDGEDTSGDATKALEAANNQGLKVATIGIGSDAGAPIPICDAMGTVTAYEQAADGSVVLSKCNHAALAALTESRDGVYSRVSDDTIAAACRKVVSWVQSHKGESVVADGHGWDELFPYAACAALCAILGAWVL